MTTSQNNYIRMDVAMPSSILHSVEKHLKSPIFQENSSKLYWGLHSQLQELHSKLMLIHGVLEEVELMGILFPDLCREWVSKLLNVLYDVDDLLDEARTRSRPAALPGKAHENVRPNLSNLYFFHWKLSHKLKRKIIKKLDEIVKVLIDYNLITNEPRQQPTTRTGSSTSASAASAGTGGNNVGKQPVARKGIMRYDPETQNSHDIPKIERSSDHEAIKSKLLIRDQGKTKIVWIVGGPGVGKTTLCRDVYDDKEVVRNFEIRLWARLDGPDTYIRALRTIASQLEMPEQIRNYKMEKPAFEVHDHDDEEEGRLIMHIMKLINGRSFLLVLDNYPPLPSYVPNKSDPENWDFIPDNFMPKLLHLSRGTEESKIIITKLKGNFFGLGSVAGDFHEVQSLSPEDGRRLFKLTAFGSNRRQLQQTPWQRDLGKEIVSNCGNNPALIRCIGNFLYGKNDWAAWKKFAREYRYPSKRHHQHIAALYYTFRHSLHFIGYSILLSRAGLFKYESLVSQVKANGLPHISKRMEMLFRVFAFVKQQSEDRWDEEPSCKLISLLPLELLDPPVQQEQAIFRFETIYEPPQPEQASPPSLQRQPPLQGRPMPDPPPPPPLLPQQPPPPPLLPQNSRSQSPSSSEYTDNKLENGVPNLKKYPQYLRSFISLGKDSIIRMPERELDAFVSRLGCVRVLDLSSTGIKVLPRSIDRLSSLRYLDLSRNDFLTLPPSICELKNLQALKLVYCDKLLKLPSCMHKLAPSLKIIRLDMSFHLTGMPSAISRLTGLECLDRFVVSGQKDGLRYLEKLNNLGGRLLLELPQQWNDAAADAEKAHLERKTGIKELRVKWPGAGRDGTGYASSAHGKKSSDDNDHYDVLKRLKPNAALQKLVIVNFGGKEFPSWITETQLSKIKISQCKRCETLPPFHRMRHLKVLTLTSMNVEYVQHGLSNPTLFFPSLKELRIGNMPNLKRWYVDWKNDLDLPNFPDLEVVEIWSCGNLTALPPFSHVDKLTFKDVPAALIESIYCHKFKEVCIKSFKIWTCLPHEKLGWGTESLIIEDSKDLETSDEKSRGTYQRLQRLDFKNPNDVRDRPEYFQHLSSLTRLVELKIVGFEMLQALPESLQHLSSLEKLAIVDCSEMKDMSSILKQLTKLKQLELSNCSEEVDCFDNTKEGEMPWNDIQNLDKLTIKGFKRLTSLPVSLNKARLLDELKIINCPMLEHVRRAISGLRWLWRLKFSNCEGVDCLNADHRMENTTLWKSICPAVVELECFKNLKTIPEFLAESWYLSKLTVSDCKSLKTLPKWKAGDVERLSVLTIKSCPEFSKEIKRLMWNYSFSKGGCEQSSEETSDSMDVPFYMKERLNIYHV